MPDLVSSRISKNHIADREMVLQLDAKELDIFLKAFPEFDRLGLEAYETPVVKVNVTVSAYLKKPKDAVEEKD